jgi:hypothetical protein
MSVIGDCVRERGTEPGRLTRQAELTSNQPTGHIRIRPDIPPSVAASRASSEPGSEPGSDGADCRAFVVGKLVV